MIIEAPIIRREEDIFERGSFACHIAELLILNENSPSLVLALEGKWGIGKTSTVNLIKEFIREKSTDAVVVDFNPWLIGSLDSVIEGFLVQLAASVNQTLNSEVASKAAAKILNFAKFLAPIKLIPGVEPWGTIVEKVLSTVGASTQAAVDMSNLDLNKRKIAVQKAIEEIGKPIIVVIDDIDRLPPAEIRILIQVVKAIGDFTRVSYLLAFDPEPVAKSLDYNGTYNGQQYLEKIVQASYPIPRIGYWHLKGFLKSHVSKLLSDINVTLSGTDDQLLNEALDATAIVRALSTPRDVVRLSNRLTITAKNTWGEVNFVDMLAFETLELKYPKISNAIRNNPELFLKTSVVEGDYILQDHLDDMSESSNSDEEPMLLKELLKTYTYLDIKNIRSILSFIFPTLLSKWEHISIEESVCNNRICTRESLLKLLHSGPNRYIFSSDEIKHFLESDTDRREILLDHLQSGSIISWLPYANQFVTNSTITHHLSLCDDLLELSRVAYKDHHQNLTDCLYPLILSLIEKGIESVAILKRISSTEISLSLSEHVILRLLSKHDIWKSGVYKGTRAYSAEELERFTIPPDDLLSAKETWLSKVRKVTSETNIFENEPEPISILFRWGQLNDNNYSEVQAFTEQITCNDSYLVSFIECFHEGKGLSGIEKLIKDIPTFISKAKSLVDPPSATDRFVAHLEAVERGEAPSD